MSKRKRVEVPAPGNEVSYLEPWGDGKCIQLGWKLHPIPGMSYAVVSGPKYVPDGERNVQANGTRLFQCEITVTPLRDTRGRPITRVCR